MLRLMPRAVVHPRAGNLVALLRHAPALLAPRPALALTSDEQALGIALRLLAVDVGVAPDPLRLVRARCGRPVAPTAPRVKNVKTFLDAFQTCLAFLERKLGLESYRSLPNSNSISVSFQLSRPSIVRP